MRYYCSLPRGLVCMQPPAFHHVFLCGLGNLLVVVQLNANIFFHGASVSLVYLDVYEFESRLYSVICQLVAVFVTEYLLYSVDLGTPRFLVW